MGNKTSQLQIRVSPSQKAVLKRLAEAAGTSVSEYVLSRALPSHRLELRERIEALRDAPDLGSALGQLADFLRELPEEVFLEATSGSGPIHLPSLLQNYAAAAVEREASRRRLPAPGWTRAVRPLRSPHFAWDLRSLRPHLMRITPPAFKRRRVFVAVPADPRS